MFEIDVPLTTIPTPPPAAAAPVPCPPPAPAEAPSPPAPTWSPATELRDAYWRMKERRIRVSVARSTRAGSIGHPCERFIFYERTVPADQRVPHTRELQAIFDLGNALEPWVVREIEDAGFEIVGRQKDYVDQELEIGARGDIRIRRAGWRRPVIVEVKGLNPYTAEKLTRWEDIRDSRDWWIRRYGDQVQIYLHFEPADDLAVFALANKVAGTVEFIDVPRDQRRIDELRARAARVRDAVHAGEPPPRTESDDCARCAFRHVCLPPRSFGAGVEVLSDFEAVEAQDLIVKRLELAPAKSEFEAVDRRLKALLPEIEGELLVGDFVVIGKRKSRGETVVKGSTWLERKYVAIPRGGAQ